MFKVGDLVEWDSHASGYCVRRKGKIKYAVAPRAAVYPGAFMPEFTTMFDGDGMPRNHESYLVEVPGGKTPKAKPKLYWPRVSQLRKVAQA